MDSFSLLGVLLNLILVVYTSLTSYANFSQGSKFDYVALEGQLTITCGNSKVQVECRETFMEPWPYDIFQGPAVEGANTIEIRSINKDNIAVAYADYDGRSGRSTEINLGVYSLFTRPLLRPGLNKLEYFITNREGRNLTRGSFEVRVGVLNSRQCESRETNRTSQEDCAHTYSVCQQYFRAQNYCR